MVRSSQIRRGIRAVHAEKLPPIPRLISLGVQAVGSVQLDGSSRIKGKRAMERPISIERPSRAVSSQWGSRKDRDQPPTSVPIGLGIEGPRARPRRSRSIRGLAALLGLAVVTTACLVGFSHRYGRLDRAPGQVIAEFELREVSTGRLHRLFQHRGRVLVIVFVGTNCPVGELYMGRLAELATKYRSRNVDFIAINSNASETTDEVAQHARECGVNFPVLKDPENRCGRPIAGRAYVRDPGDRRTGPAPLPRCHR